jgi:hypothetical protein
VHPAFFWHVCRALAACKNNYGSRDGKGTRITRRVFDPTDTDVEIIFYSWVALVSDPNRDGYGYFFLPVGNPTGTRYFTTAIILGCEQVKMCLFYYINYALF